MRAVRSCLELRRHPPFGYRWTVVALLFAATAVNYVDRQVLGILAPTLQGELGWSEADYGAIVSWFSLAYGVGFLFMGRVLDWIGTRRGLALSIIVWSLAAMGHALPSTAGGFSIARGLLGPGESGNFPGAIKTVAEWFPKRERALATGLFNAGSNVGAIVPPILVPWITFYVGLAGGVHRDGSTRLRMALHLARDLSSTGRGRRRL